MRDAAKRQDARSFVYSFLICCAVGLLAAFGWGRHWNAYTCLMLTVGSVGLWATFVTAWAVVLAADRDAAQTLEWATVIEVWFEADNEQDATAIAKRLRERVIEHPSVKLAEVQRPEEQ